MKKLKELWLKFKTWVLQKALPWLKTIGLKLLSWFKKNWMMIVNYLVIFIAYSNVYGRPEVVLAEFLLGIWMFISIAYGAFKWFMKK